MAELKYLLPGAHETLTPGDTATGITAAIARPTSGLYNQITALSALITVEDNSIRFTLDGTTPTNANGTSADTGHLMTTGQSYVIESHEGVQGFLCIDAASGSAAKIKVTTMFERIA
jgi:hypothetical protein